jgi:hypothetical protein
MKEIQAITPKSRSRTPAPAPTPKAKARIRRQLEKPLGPIPDPEQLRLIAERGRQMTRRKRAQSANPAPTLPIIDLSQNIEEDEELPPQVDLEQKPNPPQSPKKKARQRSLSAVRGKMGKLNSLPASDQLKLPLSALKNKMVSGSGVPKPAVQFYDNRDNLHTVHSKLVK